MPTLFNHRQADQLANSAATEILILDLAAMRDQGSRAVALRALAAVSKASGGYCVHLDVDVLDSEVMPALDSPQPGGPRSPRSQAACPRRNSRNSSATS